MQSTILEQLAALESKHNVRILFACESGSRAWGFPSPDSDYDARFIYAHSRDWYLSLHEKSDVIELPVNELLDINGWDVRKALRLAAKSNPVIFEWLQSPILYRHDAPFLAGFRELAPQLFSPIAGMYHYLSLAKKKYDECQEDADVKLKRVMYALRSTLSAVWIARRKSVPPMELEPLLVELPSARLREMVRELVQLKATKEEAYRRPRDPALMEFLAEGLAECDAVAASLPGHKVPHDQLDNFFRSTISS